VLFGRVTIAHNLFTVEMYMYLLQLPYSLVDIHSFVVNGWRQLLKAIIYRVRHQPLTKLQKKWFISFEIIHSVPRVSENKDSICFSHILRRDAVRGSVQATLTHDRLLTTGYWWKDQHLLKVELHWLNGDIAMCKGQLLVLLALRSCLLGALKFDCSLVLSKMNK